MVAGALVNENRAYRDHLLGLGIPVDYVETGLPHALGPILDAQGANSWAFIQQHLNVPAPSTASALVVAGIAATRRRRTRDVAVA